MIGCVLEVSELNLGQRFASGLFSCIFPLRLGGEDSVGYLCCLGVLLQLVQLCVIGLDEAFQDRMVMEAALSPDQVHAFPQLSNIQQHIFQRNCQQRICFKRELQCADLHLRFSLLFSTGPALAYYS